MLPQRRHTTRRYIFSYVTPEPLHPIVVTSSSTLPQSRHTTRRCIVKVKVKMQVFHSLISSLKTYHRTLHFTPWSLDLLIWVPFQLPGEHTVLQPFRLIELIVHIASVLPGTHFHLSQVKHCLVRYPRTATPSYATLSGTLPHAEPLHHQTLHCVVLYVSLQLQ